MESTGLLTQKSDTGGTILVDARNGFNELVYMELLWTVWHHWTVGARFMLIHYKHWAHNLFRHMGSPPVKILSQEGVNQGYPLSMVLYGITLVTLAEEIQASHPGLLNPLYADDTAIDSLEI